MANRIPPLLEPFLGLPEEASLVVLTNVLGATSNWLVLRYLYSILRGRASGEIGGVRVEGEGDDAGVVLVSFMRDLAFWKDGASRLGLDLDGLSRAGKFSFVDGLTGMFLGGEDLVASLRHGNEGRVLKSGQLDDVRNGIEASLNDVKSAKKVLIVDQMDELLAASWEEATSALALENLLLSLREHTHATILTLAADSALLQTQNTSLERSHAAFILSQAHVADVVASLRLLDTGAALDVSGVVRITRRDGEGSTAAPGRQEDGGGVEYLYYVAADGGVKVFERGA